MRARCSAAVRQLRLSRRRLPQLGGTGLKRIGLEHGLQLLDAAIALSQTLGSAEAVSGTIAHAELFEAEPAAGRVFHEPELFASGSARRAAKIGPRATVRERRMSDADELGLLAEWYAGPLVLKPDRAGGPQARYADANKFVEEDAAVRAASAFRHEVGYASPVTYAVS
jgi:hypothetical protein